jgi:4-amino-4-deoxy-L-arabinose transferase-like glycosyltransferase
VRALLAAPGRTRLAVLAVAAAAAGVGLRAWILASPLGAVGADEAVWGLMARHAADGELTTFYWGQSYAGTPELPLAAAVFLVTGTSGLALKLVDVAIFAAAVLLTWRVGRRTVGEPAAVVAALLLWIWPAYVVWKSSKAYAYYSGATALCLLVLLLALRLVERPRALDAAGLGVAAGLAWWATPQSAFLLVPTLAWLAWRGGREAWRLAPLAGAAAALGAMPWLVWNARHSWDSLVPSREGTDDTYLDHLVGFAASTFPTLLGARVPFSLDWVAGEAVGRLVTLLALAGLVWATRRRTRGTEPLLVIAVAYPFLYAVSPYADLLTEPRYLFLAAPILALLVAPLAVRAPELALAAALALSLASLVPVERRDMPAPVVDRARVPADLGPALELMREHGIDRVSANYWIAYRVTFESDERIVAASEGLVRRPEYQELVAAAPYDARLVIAGSTADPGEAPAGEERYERGRWVLLVRR